MLRERKIPPELKLNIKEALSRLEQR